MEITAIRARKQMKSSPWIWQDHIWEHNSIYPTGYVEQSQQPRELKQSGRKFGKRTRHCRNPTGLPFGALGLTSEVVTLA